MAYIVPDVIRTSATPGERLLFRTLKGYLPYDYWSILNLKSKEDVPTS